MNNTQAHYERQQRIEKVADILVTEHLEGGDTETDDLVYVMWRRAERIVDALIAQEGE